MRFADTVGALLSTSAILRIIIRLKAPQQDFRALLSWTDRLCLVRSATARAGNCSIKYFVDGWELWFGKHSKSHVEHETALYLRAHRAYCELRSSWQPYCWRRMCVRLRWRDPLDARASWSRAWWYILTQPCFCRRLLEDRGIGRFTSLGKRQD